MLAARVSDSCHIKYKILRSKLRPNNAMQNREGSSLAEAASAAASAAATASAAANAAAHLKLLAIMEESGLEQQQLDASGEQRLMRMMIKYVVKYERRLLQAN